MDPIYKIFLDHLRSDGTSYILEMDDTEFGVPVFLKYEGQKTSYCVKPQNKSPKKARRNTTNHIAPLVEESYERFLKNLKFEEELMILDIEGGCKVVYEENLKNASANVTTENGSSSDEQHFVPCNHIVGSTGEKNGSIVAAVDPRSFDEKLAAVVSEPFDQREYQSLMNEAMRRKPVMKHRNLRNMSKRYHTHETGLAYLDYYPELAAQIAEANKQERLTLLRKFFFWLENLCHEGAYMPWVPKASTEKPILDEELENS